MVLHMQASLETNIHGQTIGRGVLNFLERLDRVLFSTAWMSSFITKVTHLIENVQICPFTCRCSVT